MCGPGVLCGKVTLEVFQDFTYALGECRVLQPYAEFVLGDIAQYGDGVVIKILPAARGEFLKNLQTFLIPSPVEIVGQTVETPQ